MLSRRRKMTRMQMKMMLTTLTTLFFLRVMAIKCWESRYLHLEIFWTRCVLDFYVGNLHQKTTTIKSKGYSGDHMPENTANCWSSGCSKDISKDKSQGCAFVTVHWDSYMSIDWYSHVEAGEIPDYSQAFHEFLKDGFCSKAERAHICACPTGFLSRCRPTVSTPTSIS